MSYTIKNSDGTILLTLADGKVDQVTTSLNLIGKNVSGFGEYLNNNLIQLLSNSANTSGNPPRNPVKGQLWYDTTNKKMKVYDGYFKNVGGVLTDTTVTNSLTRGDLYFDPATKQLNLYMSSSDTYIIGPLYPNSIDNGLTIPANAVTDDGFVSHNVTVLKNYGKTIGVISSDPTFTMSFDDSNLYFDNAAQDIVPGLTINGDISYTGKIDQKQLSLYLDLDTLSDTIDNIDKTVGDVTNFGKQNQAIAIILTTMFPIAGTSYTGYKDLDPLDSTSPPYAGYGTTYSEPGVTVGSICKVLCRYSEGGSTDNGARNPGAGYQVRRFAVIPDNNTGIPAWVPFPASFSTGAAYSELILQY